MKIIITTILLALTMTQGTSSKEGRIKKLLEITNALEIGLQFGKAIGAQLEESIKSLNETIPDDVITQLYDGINKELEIEMHTQGGLISGIIEIYAKHFSEKEIDALIDFYKTPVGKKTIKEMPSIMRESMMVGQTWGEAVGAKIAAKILKGIEKKGYKVPPI